MDRIAPLEEAARAVRGAASQLERQRRTPNPRRPVRAIDLLLEELERFNLAGGAPVSSPAVMHWLGLVEHTVGLPIPGWVLGMPDTTRLHAAMLRWQGLLLTACKPEREAIPDLHEDPLDIFLLGATPGRARLGRQVA